MINFSVDVFIYNDGVKKDNAAEAYLEPSRTSTMDIFAKIING